MSSTSSEPPSSSPSFSTSTRWDVFLSFRGSDTRLNFTSHLYSALDRHSVRIFMDDPELRSGEVISDALIRAIHESKAYIVVFSENYASSPWCLDELVEIFNCHKAAKRVVIPVFYKIDPSVVRHQIGSFKEAFKKHQVHFKMETVNKWRLTLTQVAEFSGSHICENRPEADIITQIVEEILPIINSKLLHVAKYQVGLDSRVEVITALLNSATEDGFTKIGLYGMGGVGKTTLAKALFNQLLRTGSFEGCCFLANVREVSGTFKGLETLQQKFINNVLKSKKKVKVDNVEEGIMLIKERTCSAKVLVLIDDIDDPRQYECLVGSFALGSVVIITTRDQEILDKIEVEPKFQYRVNELDEAESLELFTRYAFRNAEQNNSLLVLSKDIIRHADGLPLALEVFGSYLYNQSEVGWKSYIEKLQRVPNISIQQKLIISLNAIELDDPMLKKIFLDIACFFIGWDKEKVAKIMETYYYCADHKIDILKKRCLVKINYNANSGKQELDMHDLLRDMGREIVRNISPGKPGRQSRLWVLEDVYDVFIKHKGTEAIECIIPHYQYYHSALEEKSFKIKRYKRLSTETFKKMSKLRFLYLKHEHLQGSFEQTFEDLRWFCWEYCCLECLPSEFYPKKLVILELPHSNIRTMWELNTVSHVFGKLKSLNISHSLNLSTCPDFSRVPYLETLNFHGCASLEEVHISIGSLVELDSLDLQGCVKLRSLPDTICNLRALKVLSLCDCTGLQELPTELGSIESLTKLSAIGLCVSKLPDSIGSLTKLVELDLGINKKLETLPDSICNLRSLEILRINECEKLETLPDQLWKIANLRKLDASFAILLKKLPDIGSSQIALSLQELNLNASGITSLPSGLSQLSNLQSLGLGGCRHLLSIPKLPPNLKHVDANCCYSLERLPSLSNLKLLEKLDLSDCNALTEMQGLEELTALRELDLRYSSGLTYIQGLEELTSMAILRLGGLLAYKHLTKRLCQIYSELGHQTEASDFGFGIWNYHTQYDTKWPDWITESPYWTSVSRNSKSTKLFAHLLPKSTKLFAHLLPNESHNFMGIILCFQWSEHLERYSRFDNSFKKTRKFDYSVKNTTSGFIWKDSVFPKSKWFLSQSLMIIVPKSIFSVRDNDSRIELTANNVKIVGIHLLYKTETVILEEAVHKHVSDIDALKLVDPVLQDIFLDIACFFITWEKNEVVQILETYYTNVDHNIDILKKACLLKINDQDELEMDDLLQHLGRKIARNNFPYEPGKHSRLWLSVDIYEVLKNHMGTEAIEGIIPRKVSNVSGFLNMIEDERKSFTMETFKMMTRLRFLCLDKVNLTGRFEKAFEDLRWLFWDQCPLECLPSDFHPQKLVILELPNSNMRTMWELNVVSHVFEKLKTLNMSFSQNLTSTSDFTKLPCLETINLQGCKSLEEVHISIGTLARLVSLNLGGCIKLKSLPHTICNLIALEVLTIDHCTSLESLPTEIGNMQSLRKLIAYGLNVSKVPNSIRRLSKLVELNLRGSKYLKTLPHTICNLRSLEILDILGCNKLEALPTALGNIKSLRELDLEGLTVSKLPDSIGHLSKLVELYLRGNKNLDTLPDTICNLRSLKILDISGCDKLEILPNISNLKQLEKFLLFDCSALTVVLGLEELTAIKLLHLKGCNSTLLANIFTERFFQICSEFQYPIQIYASSEEFPEWISQSSNLGPTMYMDLPADVSHGFLGMILCFKHSGDDKFYLTDYSVKNTTSDFIWSGSFDIYEGESLMVIVPRSIFSVRDGDDRIELTTKKAEILGIHLLYNTEFVMIDEYDSTDSVDEDITMEEAFV